MLKQDFYQAGYPSSCLTSSVKALKHRELLITRICYKLMMHCNEQCFERTQTANISLYDPTMQNSTTAVTMSNSNATKSQHSNLQASRVFNMNLNIIKMCIMSELSYVMS